MEVFACPFDSEKANLIAEGHCCYSEEIAKIFGNDVIDLRTQILSDFWAEIFHLLKTICPRNLEETHEVVIAAESMLHLFKVHKTRVELIANFANIFKEAKISGILKVRIFEYFGSLLSHHRLWRAILESERESIENRRALEIQTVPPSLPLVDSKLRSEYEKEQRIRNLKEQKTTLEAELVADFMQKQQTLFKEAAIEIEDEIKSRGKLIEHSEMARLVETITTPKIALLKNELQTKIEIFKSNLNIDVKLAKLA